ncbi:ECF transporter S component [Raineyella sp. W15-4]|uniref:ECF transporter S component n=1 Tax=Raineyella sp. W15-4 TaxID=3081651 RepID=UPI002954467A|nr:ECF transporter S component [Raineyella sp. W15-4]WOQ18731.1 ECF transporter S component [Raineyella sp. W15-4]
MSLTDRKPDRTVRPAVSARKVAIMAVFIALSAVGSLIKLPSPLGTVALDSAPGFFTAVAFGGWLGFVVAAVGHLLTSAIAGFPLTLPLHLLIALGMGICAQVFCWLGRRGTVGMVAGLVVTAVLNSFGLGLVVLPVGGWGMYVASVPSLLVGAVVNLVIATIAYYAVRNTRLVN